MLVPTILAKLAAKTDNIIGFLGAQLGSIILFAILYWAGHYAWEYYEIHHRKNKKYKPIDFTPFDAIYFSLVTQTTVGYGDFTPGNQVTRIINMFQLIAIYGVSIFAII